MPPGGSCSARSNPSAPLWLPEPTESAANEHGGDHPHQPGHHPASNSDQGGVECRHLGAQLNAVVPDLAAKFSAQLPNFGIGSIEAGVHPIEAGIHLIEAGIDRVEA